MTTQPARVKVVVQRVELNLTINIELIEVFTPQAHPQDPVKRSRKALREGN